MAGRTSRSSLVLEGAVRDHLQKIARSQTEPVRRVRRAKALLLYSEGKSFAEIARTLKVSRDPIYLWVDRALAIGPEAALEDKFHRPHDPVITEEAKAWVVHIACTKPKDLGYAAELWTIKALADHVRATAGRHGHRCLKSAAKSTVWRILNENDLKPHKIKYYLERRDPDFEPKMARVLVVYEEVNILNARGFDPFKEAGVITVSVDEKPGIQAIRAIASELSPEPGRHQSVGRDYEYKRLGTLSLLAGLDLHSGYVHGVVEERHRSREFIGLLREIDAFYPEDCRIRLILDNHSAHISKETMEWLSIRPGRFEYVHTPTHGSWLNIIETLFSKMARTFLRGIRVETKLELKQRILQGIQEINQQPVVHRWKAFDL